MTKTLALAIGLAVALLSACSPDSRDLRQELDALSKDLKAAPLPPLAPDPKPVPEAKFDPSWMDDPFQPKGSQAGKADPAPATRREPRASGK